MSDNALELADIQGNVLAGFNTEFEVLVSLTAPEALPTSAIADWLSSLADQVSTVADVRAQRTEMKAGNGGTPIVWLCVSLGSRLIRRLRPDLMIREEAFSAGLIKRSAGALGDRTNPDEWRVGGSHSPIDVFLVIAANDQNAAESKASSLVQDAASLGLDCSYRETGKRIRDLEHFGFRDGISQPSIRGYDTDGEIGAGHFVFGYEREQGSGAVLPGVDPGGFLRNGSLLVFRRLAQDVRSFREFCSRAAGQLEADWPGLTPAFLAALIVGRWPSGAPVSTQHSSDPGIGPDINSFTFSDDMAGRACPFGAHIRKVNPRAGPKDLALVPRILRRGIPFGPEFDSAPEAERGLAFMSFQTSIRNQLETLTGTWMNSPLRPASGAGHDLLVGRSTGERRMTLQGPRGPVIVSDQSSQWVTPTGGAYLFAPGRSALSKLNSAVAKPGFWKVQKLLLSVGDRIRRT